MVGFQKTVPDPLGGLLGLKNSDVYVINRTGSATVIGEVVQFDLGATATEVTAGDFAGGDGSTLSNVVTAATAGIVTGMFAICLEAAADDARMRVRVQGIVQALTEDTPAVMEKLHAENNNISMSADVSATSKALGIALESGISGSELNWIIFDGVNGMGSPTA